MVDYEGNKFGWDSFGSNWGKFSHTYAYPFGGGLTLDGIKRGLEALDSATIKRLLIVEQATRNIHEDVVEDFSVVYVGTSIEDIERYLQQRLVQEDIDDDAQYVFRVYQFAEKDEPTIVGKYVLDNWELMKRIGEYE